MFGISVRETGGPEVLEWVELPDPEVGDGQLLVQVACAGLNYIDTYHRGGLYPMSMPFTPGMEGAGTVVAVGSGVSIPVGTRVAWPSVMGAYAERAVVPADRVVVVPDGVPFPIAVTLMVQGMTAHYLAFDTFPLAPGHRCLVHAAAGGVGLLLVQIAKHLGAEVVATVGTEDKAELARQAGADHVIRYRDVDFVEAIGTTIGPKSIDVVYDGVGKSTFAGSLAVLTRRGTMVSFGNASGPVDPVTPLQLMQGGSLYLTRPNLADYAVTPDELARRAADLFGWYRDGWLDVTIGHEFALRDAAEAHRLIESRGSVGKIVLVASEG